jgi:zinc transporter ZupT
MKRTWLWMVLPLVVLVFAIAVFLNSNPLAPLGVSAPPLEKLTVERTVLDDKGISLLVRAGGSEPMRIAQIQIDGAYWEFHQTPPGELPRLATAQIDIPYPWQKDETHKINVITNTGVGFEHEIPVAIATPQFSLTRLLAYALLGLYVGVMPVALGMLFYPSLKHLGEQGMKFLLALTIGMLTFLLVDTIEEGLELASSAAKAFSGNALVWLATVTSFLAIFTFGRRNGKPPEGFALATFLGLGIGLHNLGEGLAIGSAFAVGEAALGSLLVIGFTLHNVTEGIGIAAPLVGFRPKAITFISLTALAGLPAVLGCWLGAFSYSPQWGALFFGIGAGAVLQVMVEVGSYLVRRTSKLG